MARLAFALALVATQLATAAAFLSAPGAITTRRLPPPHHAAARCPAPAGASSPAPVRSSGRWQTSIRLAPSYDDQHQLGGEQQEHRRHEQQAGSKNDPTVTTAAGLSKFELPRRELHRGTAGAAPRFAVLTASAVAAGLAVAAFAPGPAAAAAKAVTTAAIGGEHLHAGQKIANFFRRGGLPDWATLMAISAMPVVELRGGVPVGIWMGMPTARVFGLCVAGNMIPIPVILLALKSGFVQRLAKPVLDRAREKASSFGDEESQALALTLFVGIPLPGTGAWTGAMGAFLLGMPFQKAR